MVTLDHNTKKVIELCEVFGVHYEIVPRFDPVRRIEMSFYSDSHINTFSDEAFVSIAYFISEHLRYSDILFRLKGEKGHWIWGKDILFEQVNGKYRFRVTGNLHIERANIEDLEDAEDDLIKDMEAEGIELSFWWEGGYAEGEVEVSFAIEIEDESYNGLSMWEYIDAIERINRAKKIVEELLEPYIIEE